MKPHEHTHEQMHEHVHGHSHGDHHRHASPPQFTAGLLMSSSVQRVLGALGLIVLLWLAVAWAVLFVD